MMVTELVVRAPESLVDPRGIDEQCTAIEAWAEHIESVPELRDAANKLAAIDEYLSRTSTDGRARVAAAMRRLEERIGGLLQERRPGERTDLSLVSDGLTANERYQFRQMAEHPEIVEEVIASSTDEEPASRRKVMNAMRDAERATPRRPLTDEWRGAVLDLNRVTERLDRLCRDDRFDRNASQIADSYINDLTRAHQALERAISLLKGV